MMDRSRAASVDPAPAPSPDQKTDAKGLQEALHEQLFANDEPSHALDGQTAPESGRSWAYLRRGAKIAIGLAISRSRRR